MIVAIHQPNFVPWLGYFYKMLRCDTFVLLDDAQYTSDSFIKRNRIKTPQGVHWLTVPVSPKLGTAIRDVEIRNVSWPIKMHKTLRASYGRAPHFDELIRPLEEIFDQNASSLCSLNIATIELVASWLQIPCRVVKSSELPGDGSGDQRLVRLVNAVGGDTYLSGYGGRTYQSEETFSREGLVCRYYDFAPPVYPQLWGDFIPGLSVLDCLFNCGKQGTAEIVRTSGKGAA